MRRGVRSGRWLPAGALLAGLLLAPPVLAAPRVTLTLEGSTLHQTLRQLQKHTGLQFRSQEGAGDDDYKEPANARKARFAWKGAPLGVVLRELCGAYGLTATAMGDSGYWVQPGKLPARKEALQGGIGVSVPAITQSENLIFTPGQGKPRVTRSLSVRLVCRAQSGDGDVIGPLTRLSLTDDTGKTLEPPISSVSEGGYGLPDERMRTLYFPWNGPHPQRLRRIEGELALYSETQEQRFVVKLPAKELPLEQQSGSVKLKVTKVTQNGRQTQASLRLTWPKETEVTVFGASAIRVLMKWDNGQSQRVYSGTSQGESNGEKWAQLELNAGFESLPSSLEVLVPTRTNTGKKVAFRLENVVLPFGQPVKFRTEPLAMKPRDRRPTLRMGNRSMPRSLYDVDGGTLVIPKPAAPMKPESGAQAVVGISRKNEDGSWTAMRWVQVDVGEEAGRLPYLLAGTYRLRVQYWERGAEPGPPRRLPLPEREVTVDVRAGQDAAL